MPAKTNGRPVRSSKASGEVGGGKVLGPVILESVETLIADEGLLVPREVPRATAIARVFQKGKGHLGTFV